MESELSEHVEGGSKAPPLGQSTDEGQVIFDTYIVIFVVYLGIYRILNPLSSLFLLLWLFLVFAVCNTPFAHSSDTAVSSALSFVVSYALFK